MESADDRIDDDEVLLRRIPPSTESFQSTCERGDGGLRASSAMLKTITKQGEEHLSCSRLRITSPQALLDDLRNDGKDPHGWHVCEFRVSDVTELGLEIAFTPTDRDPGHCSITGVNGSVYPNNKGNKAKKLARKTRILTPEEIEDLSRS